MKTTNKILRTTIILCMTALAFTACRPEDGKDGINGQDGTPGAQGPVGQDGNANVVSKTFTATQISWTDKTIYGTNYKVATLNMPEITQNIIDNGAVLVYGGFFWESPWSALPISFFETGKTSYYTYGIATGKVTLRVHNSTNAVPSTPGIPFRVVVIEGKAAGKARSNGVNLNDYEQTKAYFNLKE